MADFENTQTQEPQDLHREEKARQRRNGGRHAEGFIVDLGRHSRKDIDRLRKGRGPLMEDVEDAIQELRDTEAISDDVQPVIVIVSEKKGKGSTMFPVLLPPGIPAALPLDIGNDDDDDEEDDED